MWPRISSPRRRTRFSCCTASLDLAAIEQAAERLAEADMIYAFGSGGNSSMIASELQNRLFRLGLRVTASSDHSMQLMMAAAAQADATC